MSETLRGLEQHHIALETGLRELESAKSRERREKLGAFAETLDRELDELYGERIQALRKEVWQAKGALDRAREADALTQPREIPIGTTMEEWARQGRGFGWESANTPLKRTGLLGILEVITTESTHPGNLRYGKAKPGDVVIRVLLKDGTPSKRYINSKWDMDNWRPVASAEATTKALEGVSGE